MCCLIVATFMGCVVLPGCIFYLIAPSYFGDPEVDTFLYSWITNNMLPICLTSNFLGFLFAEIAITTKLNKYDFNWLGALCVGLIGLIFSGFLSSILTSIAFDIAKGTIDYQLIIFVCAVSVLVWIPVTLLGALILGSIPNVTIVNVKITIVALIMLLSFFPSSYNVILAIVVLILAVATMSYKIVNLVFNNLIDEQTRQILGVDATKIAFLTAGFCMSLPVAFLLLLQLAFQLEWVEPREILVVGGTTMTSLAFTGIPLIDSIVFQPKRMLANYRKSRPNLIKP